MRGGADITIQLRELSKHYSASAVVGRCRVCVGRTRVSDPHELWRFADARRPTPDGRRRVLVLRWLFSMSTADLPKREAPDSLMLTGFWYRALPSSHVSRGQVYKAMLLEIPLVIGRDKSGRAFALRDACPHRGMPLSCGRFDGEQVECGYHGWRFDAQSGQCQLIPSLTADHSLKVDRIYAGNFACEERDDFIWVFIPDPGPASAGFSCHEEPAEPAPRVPTFSDKYRTAYLTADLPCSVDHGIIGLMDPAHGPFV